MYQYFINSKTEYCVKIRCFTISWKILADLKFDGMKHVSKNLEQGHV